MNRVPEIGEGYRGADGHIGYLLLLAWHAVRTTMNRLLEPYQLSAAQYAVLTVLDVQPSLSVADLARATATTPQSTAGLVSGLEEAGLVTRSAHPGNRRWRQVHLTDKGKRLVAVTRPVINSFEGTLETTLDDDTRHALRTWLVRTAAHGQNMSRPDTG